jgi:peptidoglycan/xylan/chitin deacetylase (PgdA/CDA1 family)
LRPAVIDSVLANLEEQLGVRTVEREPHRWMTAAELHALSASDGTEIGAHTLTHPFLASPEAKEQWREIEGSCRALEELLETPASLFAYPYGSRDAFTAVTTQLVRDVGYTMVCTAAGRIARAESDSLQIP